MVPIILNTSHVIVDFPSVYGHKKHNGKYKNRSQRTIKFYHDAGKLQSLF
jgi:hypothetical protein